MKSKIINLEKVADIICSRLLLTSAETENHEEILTNFLNRIPSHPTIIQIFCNSNDYYIPFEWLDDFIKVMKIEIPELINFLTRNSLNHSISKHFSNYFANVTQSGAIYYNELELTNRILQPGAIVQQDVEFGEYSIMMSGSIALRGSKILPNSYSSIDDIISPNEMKEPINKTAKIDPTTQIKKGVSIGANTVIDKNVKIGAGTQIGSNAFINENVKIHRACLINDDVMIPRGVIVPIGFNYKQEAVEFSRKIPAVIRKIKNSLFYFRLESGFVDLNLCIKHGNLIYEYFEKFKLFPNECGKQLALNEELIQMNEEFIEKIYAIFNSYSLVFALSYWENSLSNCFNNEMMKLTQSALNDIINHKSDLLIIDDFLFDETRTVFLLFIANNLKVFVDKGVEVETLIATKKFLFEIADEIIAKMSIFSNAQTKRPYLILQSIIELTKEFNKI